MSGFVYIWRDRKHKRFYIGSHWGNINDGYICSSNWMRDSYRRRPSDFKRRILANGITDRTELYNVEQYWFNFIKSEEIGKRYYNLTLKVKPHWSINPEKLHRFKTRIVSEETKKKMSLSAMGKTITPEARQKLSKYFKGRSVGPFTEEHKKKIGLGNKGVTRKRSLEGNAKSAASNTGKKRSEETKRKMSIAAFKRYANRK